MWIIFPRMKHWHYFSLENRSLLKMPHFLLFMQFHCLPFKAFVFFLDPMYCMPSVESDTYVHTMPASIRSSTL